MKRLPQGVFPPLVTPFKKDRFAKAEFVRSVERLESSALAGYVVLGSNGEGALLSDDEAIEVVEAAAAARGAEKPLIVGTGRESTRATVEFSKRAVQAGADALLVVPPSYYRSRMSDSALEFHYRSVADESKVPVVLYHVPKFAPVEFSATLVERLSSHPNILGMKDTSGNFAFLGEVLRHRPDNFRVYIGSASFFLAGLATGADGGILALANLMPDDCVHLFDVVRRGDLEAARALQSRLLPVNQAVTARYGIAGLKFAMDLIGVKVGDPRRPLEPLSQKEAARLTSILEAAGVLSTNAE